MSFPFPAGESWNCQKLVEEDLTGGDWCENQWAKHGDVAAETISAGAHPECSCPSRSYHAELISSSAAGQACVLHPRVKIAVYSAEFCRAADKLGDFIPIELGERCVSADPDYEGLDLVMLKEEKNIDALVGEDDVVSSCIDPDFAASGASYLTAVAAGACTKISGEDTVPLRKKGLRMDATCTKVDLSTNDHFLDGLLHKKAGDGATAVWIRGACDCEKCRGALLDPPSRSGVNNATNATGDGNGGSGAGAGGPNAASVNGGAPIIFLGASVTLGAAVLF